MRLIFTWFSVSVLPWALRAYVELWFSESIHSAVPVFWSSSDASSACIRWFFPLGLFSRLIPGSSSGYGFSIGFFFCVGFSGFLVFMKEIKRKSPPFLCLRFFGGPGCVF